MQLKNENGLIGDVLGTLPLMYDVAKNFGGLSVEIHPEAKWMYELIPENYNIKVVESLNYDNPWIELDIGMAFNYSMQTGLYMNQCWHSQIGYNTPEQTIPELNVPDVDVPIYDFVFAPFSRSTPQEQKWQIEKWEQLSYEFEMAGYRVCVFGNSKHDKKLDNCFNEFDRPMIEVINILKKAKKGCISINTGISHLCYVVGCKNYLLNNQGSGWAVQPHAISIETYIPEITVEEMFNFILNN